MQAAANTALAYSVFDPLNADKTISVIMIVILRVDE